MSGPPNLIGQTLESRYRITGLLGEGGMGQVYEGVQVSLDRKVAVKTLHPRLAHEARFRDRFLREAISASTIKHPNVVQILDYGDTSNGSVYFVMEHLEGRDLGALLREQGRLPWPRAREILLQAVRALGAAHAHGIIHRDIKPGNCFLAEWGHGEVVKLLDFGIAKVGADAEGSEGGQRLTGTGEVFGTASYMAPEQARAEPLDTRSDIYSLGIMAYEMLTGQVPFSGRNAFLVINKHLNEPPRPPRELEPSIPAAVEAIVMRAIAKKTEDRFGSMAEIEAALQAIPARTETKPRKETMSRGTTTREIRSRQPSVATPHEQAGKVGRGRAPGQSHAHTTPKARHPIRPIARPTARQPALLENTPPTADAPLPRAEQSTEPAPCASTEVLAKSQTSGAGAPRPLPGTRFAPSTAPAVSLGIPRAPLRAEISGELVTMTSGSIWVDDEVRDTYPPPGQTELTTSPSISLSIPSSIESAPRLHPFRRAALLIGVIALVGGISTALTIAMIERHKPRGSAAPSLPASAGPRR